MKTVSMSTDENCMDIHGLQVCFLYMYIRGVDVHLYHIRVLAGFYQK